MADFARYSGIHKELYRDYEVGKGIPNKETLEKIIQGGCLTETEATLLRELRNEEKARRNGVDLRPPDSIKIDVSSVAKQVRNELEYELKRTNIHLNIRTRRALLLRIEIILKNALGES